MQGRDVDSRPLARARGLGRDESAAERRGGLVNGKIAEARIGSENAVVMPAAVVVDPVHDDGGEAVLDRVRDARWQPQCAP